MQQRRTTTRIASSSATKRPRVDSADRDTAERKKPPRLGLVALLIVLLARVSIR